MKVHELDRIIRSGGIFPAQVMPWASRPNPAQAAIGERIRVPEFGNREFYNNGKLWLACDPAPFAQSGVASSVTGTTAETTLASIVIPGGLMGPNGLIRVRATFSWSNTANAKTTRLKFAGLSFYSATLSTGSGLTTEGRIANRNNLSSQIGGPLNVASGFGVNTNAADLVAVAANTAQDQTLLLTGQCAVGTDTVTLESYTVEVLPA